MFVSFKVVTVPFGKWDVRKIVHDGKSTDFVTYLTECFELGMHSVRVANKLHQERSKENIPEGGVVPVTQISGILDWDGFAWGQLFSYQCACLQ